MTEYTEMYQYLIDSFKAVAKVDANAANTYLQTLLIVVQEEPEVDGISPLEKVKNLIGQDEQYVPALKALESSLRVPNPTA